MLDAGDAPRRKALAVAQAIDKVDDGRLEISRQNEIAVQRMCFARAFHGSARRHERLREHLPAKNAPGAEVSVVAAVDVALERLELEEMDEVFDGVGHGVMARYG